MQDIGRLAFEAYDAAYLPHESTAWEDLSAHERSGWVACAVKVVDFVRGVDVDRR